MPADLTDKYVANTYKGVLHANGEEIPANRIVQVYDGAGNTTAAKIGREGVHCQSLSARGLIANNLEYPKNSNAQFSVICQTTNNGTGQIESLELKPVNEILCDAQFGTNYSRGNNRQNMVPIPAVECGLVTNVTESQVSVVTRADGGIDLTQQGQYIITNITTEGGLLKSLTLGSIPIPPIPSQTPTPTISITPTPTPTRTSTPTPSPTPTTSPPPPSPNASPTPTPTTTPTSTQTPTPTPTRTPTPTPTPTNAPIVSYASLISYPNLLINAQGLINQRQIQSGDRFARTPVLGVGPAAWNPKGYFLDRWHTRFSDNENLFDIPLFDYNSEWGPNVARFFPRKGITQVVEGVNVNRGLHTLSWYGDPSVGVSVIEGGFLARQTSPRQIGSDGRTWLSYNFQGGQDIRITFRSKIDNTDKYFSLPKLERSSAPTDFEFANFGAELLKCLRYFCKTYHYPAPVGLPIGNSSGFSSFGPGGPGGSGYITSNTSEPIAPVAQNVGWSYPVPMRDSNDLIVFPFSPWSGNIYRFSIIWNYKIWNEKGRPRVREGRNKGTVKKEPYVWKNEYPEKPNGLIFIERPSYASGPDGKAYIHYNSTRISSLAIAMDNDYYMDGGEEKVIAVQYVADAEF